MIIIKLDIYSLKQFRMANAPISNVQIVTNPAGLGANGSVQLVREIYERENIFLKILIFSNKKIFF